MDFARKTRPRFSAYIALSLFAGIRPEEIEVLRWKDIDLKRGIVTVDSVVSKVRQRRIVHLLPAAVEWLKLAKKLKGALPVKAQFKRRTIKTLRKVLGFERWPHDVLRHTAASMWLAKEQDAAKVALELGNSVSVLLRHYRELVTREQAKQFWAIRPAKVK